MITSVEREGAEEGKKEGGREKWDRSLDFLFSCIGFAVGLGNIWRFPYLCFEHGGAVFFIPYFICVFLGGLPIFFLEVSLGQYMSLSGSSTWKICPIFKGIGVASSLVMLMTNVFYNIILAWAVYYFFASFADVLPWSNCDNKWNTDKCIDFTNSSAMTANTTYVDSVTEFFERRMLDISTGIEDVGTVKWDLALSLVLAWIVVYFCLWKGIKQTGKIVWFTSLLPYILLTILLIRGATLPGAKQGIEFFIVPKKADLAKLASMKIWVDAGTQIFFSYAVAIGALTSLGSYNKFHHKSYKDVFILALANSGTSIFAGFVIFSALGYMAHEQGVSVQDVAAGGPGLAFIAYPKAISMMPVPQLWSCIFFLCLFMLGLDSQFVGVESVLTNFTDLFPSLRHGWRRMFTLLVFCLLYLAVGLCMVTNGGIYVFELFNYYVASFIILLIALSECVAVLWIYGGRKYYRTCLLMYTDIGSAGKAFIIYALVACTITAPIYCLALFVMSVVNYSELSYKFQSTKEVYNYPSWAVGIGWALACVSFVWIPLMAAYNFLMTCASPRPISSLFRPEGLEPHQILPEDRTANDTAGMKMSEQF